MAWGNRKDEELPAELKGKTPEEIAAAVRAGEEAQRKLADRADKDQARDLQFETFGTTLNELKDTLKAVNERTVAPARTTTTTTDNEPASFITDPDLAFNQRLAPFASLVMQQSAMTAKQEAQRALSRKQATEKNNIDASLFDRFEGEILELAKNCTAQQLANPATWAHLFYNVKGRHTDEIVSNPKAFFTEDASRAPAAEAGHEDKLTDQELAICAKMGVKPENYLKNRKASSAMPF